MIVGLLLNLLIFGLFIFGVKKLFSRSHTHIQKENGVRRFFQLLLLFALIIISAVGVSGLLGRLIRINDVLNTDRGNLALESAFTVVGVPLLAIIVLWTRGSITKDREELQTLIWDIYLTLISIISLIVVIDAQMNLFGGLFTSDLVRGKDISQLLIWGAIWLFHFRLHNKVGRGEHSLGEHLIGSLIGLALSFVGLLNVLGAILSELFGLNEKSLMVGAEKPIIDALITFAVGAAVWFIYWVRTAEKGVKENLWYAYVLLIGVGGGLLSTVISGSLVLDNVLVWFFGETDSNGKTFFQGTPQLIGTSLTGLIILWYHRQVLQSSQEVQRTDIRRIYEYGVAGIGLLAASGGVTMILVSIIESIFKNTEFIGESSINTLLAAITLIVVGAPVWWLQWNSIQKKVNSDSIEEQSSVVRRIYLLLLFGVVGVTAVIVLLTTAYLVFYDLFQTGVGSNTINKIRFPVAIFLTAGVVSTYHWNIYKKEKDVEIRRPSIAPTPDKLAFFVTLNIKPRSTQKVLDVLTKYAVHVRKENGCERLDVLTDPRLKNTIYLYEIWSTSQAHLAHLESEGFKGWKEYSDPLISEFEVKTLEL